MRILTFLAFILLFNFGFAQHASSDKEVGTLEDKEIAEHAGKDGKEEFNPVETIMHHISDAYEWHLWGEGEESVAIPLPLVLIGDGKFDIFSVAKLEGGETYNGYKLEHGKLISTKGLTAFAVADLFKGDFSHKFYDISITKNVAAMLISMLLMFVIFTSVASSYKKSLVPRGIAGFVEPLVVFIRDEVARPNIGEAKYAKYMPYLLTLFFFIWINNLLGLLPGAANVTGNIALTFVLALIALLVINISGNKAYWGHMLWMPGVPVPVKILLMPIELVGVITKPFALMIRLFANMVAGHIIILSLISLIFIFKSSLVAIGAVPLTLFINVLELLVAFLQAFIFTMLVALFIGMAVQDHDHEHAEAH